MVRLQVIPTAVQLMQELRKPFTKYVFYAMVRTENALMTLELGNVGLGGDKIS